jgi:hypothetical protein
MRVRTIFIAATALSLATSVTMAAGWTERLNIARMTVVKVNPASGLFLCAEHQRWIAVEKDDLRGVSAGDVVGVDRREDGPARLVVLRQAADEPVPAE